MPKTDFEQLDELFQELQSWDCARHGCKSTVCQEEYDAAKQAIENFLKGIKS